MRVRAAVLAAAIVLALLSVRAAAAGIRIGTCFACTAGTIGKGRWPKRLAPFSHPPITSVAQSPLGRKARESWVSPQTLGVRGGGSIGPPPTLAWARLWARVFIRAIDLSAMYLLTLPYPLPTAAEGAAMVPRVERKLAAEILAADVVGYSRLVSATTRPARSRA